MRSPGPTTPNSALRMVVLPVPVPPDTRKARRASSTARNNASPRWSTVPSARRAARSCVAGRNTRSDRQVPSTATGGSTACRRTPMSASQPSTYGHASSSLRPAATASRCASLRTAASSVNRTAGALQTPTAVDPDGRRAADEDVGGAWIAQQLVERARAGELLTQGAQRGEDIEVRRHPARFGAHRGGDRGGVGVAARRREPGAHPLDQADRRARSRRTPPGSPG